MQSNPVEMQALQRAALELEPPLTALEERLAALASALRERDSQRIEAEATALHRALAAAVKHRRARAWASAGCKRSISTLFLANPRQ